METRLSKKLADKIASLDISHPYVWKLRLSEADFNELEVCLSAIMSDCGVAALAKPENATSTIVYMAEWYKRKYQSGNRNQLIENLDLETLWTNSGISKKRYLYQDDSGQKRWLYSIYVLGGLAIQHELNRHDKMKFLKDFAVSIMARTIPWKIWMKHQELQLSERASGASTPL